MDTTKKELNDLFAIPPVTDLTPNVLGELQSILRIHSISPQELSYKWESYTIKMGTEQTKLDLTTARAFKKDLQEMLERESRGKAHVRSADKRGAHATPKSAAKGGDDVFGMLEGVVPNNPIKVHCFHLRQEKWSNSVTKDESGVYREGSKAR